MPSANKKGYIMTKGVVIQGREARLNQLRRHWQKNVYPQALHKLKMMEQYCSPESMKETERRKLDFADWLQYEKELRRKEELIRTKVKRNPPDELFSQLILKKFDLWYTKHKNNVRVLYEELRSGCNFRAEWFPSASEKELFGRVLTPEIDERRYAGVFEYCKNKIRRRLTKLDPKGMETLNKNESRPLSKKERKLRDLLFEFTS